MRTAAGSDPGQVKAQAGHAAARALPRLPASRPRLGGTTPFVVHRFDNYARQFPEARANITEPPSEYLRRLSFDTVSTHAEAMRCAFATFDPGQFVFGTDYPHVPGGLQIFVDTLRAASLSPSDQARVAHQNATTLLNIH